MADDYSGITRPYGDTPLTSGHPQTDLNVADVNQISRGGSPDTGDVRRAYDFGSSYTEVGKSRDPLLHIMNKFRKKPTTDWRWKYSMKRKYSPSQRYGYVVGLTGVGELVTADASVVTTETAMTQTALRDFLAADIEHGANTFAANSGALPTSQNDQFCIAVMGDYKQSGNITNVIGRSSGSSFITLGQAGTKPTWFLPKQILKIGTGGTAIGATQQAIAGYFLVRIMSSFDFTIVNGATTYGEGVMLNVKVIKSDATNKYPISLTGATWSETTALLYDVSHSTGTSSLAQKLEPARSYVSGSAYHELDGYGASWRPQPYSSDYGLNEIFKATALMSGRAMSTELKFEKNPWQEEWEGKVLEAKWDMAHATYFGEQFTDDDGITYTEGFVNWALNNANSFGFALGTKTVDDFLEDFSALNDKRVMPDIGGSTGFFVQTAVWNWFAKLTGYMQNNAELSSNYMVTYDGNGHIDGIRTRKILVDGTTMNLILDPHLDGTNVKMCAINFNTCAIRPFIGNGRSRDFQIIPGVKTVYNSGQDYRVDLIMADVGFEFNTPEANAVWI